MTIREALSRQLQRLAVEYVPAAMTAVEARMLHLRTSWDQLNCSLARRALPEDRKGRVGRLELDQKASRAGQGKPVLKVARPSKKTSRKQGC